MEVNSTLLIGDVPITSLKSDYVQIENSAQYLFKIQKIDPYDEDVYLDYWRNIKKQVVEGYWGEESKGYRYCPASLFFYANFGLIESTDEAKITTYIKPLIQDIEWELAYLFLEAEGFSGFYLDDNITCDKLALTYNIDILPETPREKLLFSSNGKLKKYEDARQYVRRLHHEPLGQALFFNEARNINIGGSRGR